jgi:hypothetical protein
MQLPPGLGLEGLFGFGEDDEDTTYMSGDGSKYSGSDTGDGASQSNATMDRQSSVDPAYEPAYVRIGSDVSSYGGSPLGDVEDVDSPFLKRGLTGYPYMTGTELDYLASFSAWQGEWGMDDLSSMQNYNDALVNLALSGISGWDWNLTEDGINVNDDKAKTKRASVLTTG